MVVVNSFQDVFEASAKIVHLNLPQGKENFLKVEFGNYKVNKVEYKESEPPLPFAASELFHCNIVGWRRLTAVHRDCKPVYEVSFDIKESNFCFKPGDTIGIVPRNNQNEINFLLNHLNLSHSSDLYYTLSIDSRQNGTKAKVPTHIPAAATIRHVLTHCVDFRTVVKKLFLMALSRYTKDESERKVLEYLCSKEGANAYTKHILNKNICLLDLLAYFKSCKPPIEVLLQHLPRLLPRPYSIANSPQKDPHIVKICFSVMDIGNNRKGLTTGWLENIILKKEQNHLEDTFENLSVEELTIPIYLRKNMNSFELPEKLDSPVILIGPGTGVAPYIGFLEQIECRKTEAQDESWETWLFFGCRHPKLNFIYEEELNNFVDKKIINRLETAFSRYQTYETKYVQDAIKKNGEDIVRLIDAGSRIFVCGDLKTMAAQVREAIVSCLVTHARKSIEEAEKIIYDLQKDKLYIVDIWN